MIDTDLDELPPGDDETDDEAFVRLASLSAVEYDRCRKAEADRLGIRASVLDRIISGMREDNDDQGGSNLLFPEVEPWGEPVNGADLISDISATFARHIVLPAGAADGLALWVLFAHCHDAARISPLLAITSPTPECGKTNLLTLLSALVPKACPVSNISPSAVFRTVEAAAPTLLLDEADTWLRQNDEARGVFNSGHNRGAAYVIRTTGDNHHPTRFSTWCPKAIALIGNLPATLASRSIHVRLRRKGADESAEEVRADDLDKHLPLLRRAARWAADNWRPLFAIAQCAGGDWRERAESCSVALTAGTSTQTASEMLLSDIRDIMGGDDRIATRDLIPKLIDMDNRPWCEWGKSNKPITDRGIAKLLEPFGVKPKTINLGSTSAKGYLLEQLSDLFARYAPHSYLSLRHNPQKTAENGGTLSVTCPDEVTDREGMKPAENLESYGVTDTEGGMGDDIEREAIMTEHLFTGT